jgi:hypothetical protein
MRVLNNRLKTDELGEMQREFNGLCLFCKMICNQLCLFGSWVRTLCCLSNAGSWQKHTHANLILLRRW